MPISTEELTFRVNSILNTRDTDNWDHIRCITTTTANQHDETLSYYNTNTSLIDKKGAYI